MLRILSQVHEALDEIAEALACVRKAAAIEQRVRSEETESRARALSARRRLDQARLETERYKRLAMEDALTGLANRRQLDERLAALMREAHKPGAVVTVALADVDHFKGINDRFSHAVGDEVLRCVGEILRAHCRLGDLAGRYGGEEFMLVFRSLDMRAALEICERVRRAVEAWDWALDPSAAARDALDGPRLEQLVRGPAGPHGRRRPLALRGEAPRAQPDPAGRGRSCLALKPYWSAEKH